MDTVGSTQERFDALLGAHRGRGRSSDIDLIWSDFSFTPTTDERIIFAQLLASAHTPAGRVRALAALSGGSEQNWPYRPYAVDLLNTVLSSFAADVVSAQRQEIDQLLVDLGLRQCLSTHAHTRTNSSVATAIFKLVRDHAKALAATNNLNTAELARACERAYENALIITCGRLAYARRHDLAHAHTILAPTPSLCAAAVRTWLEAKPHARKHACVAALSCCAPGSVKSQSAGATTTL
jgi:hypothetical protein